MRLATRTGLAALLAATVTLVGVGLVFRAQFEHVLRGRVDDQLEARAGTAPILAAVSERLARSELRSAVEGARVQDLNRPERPVVEIGLLPEAPFPPIDGPGFTTERVAGEDWRTYTVEVADVPAVGDRVLVQLVAPLGDVESQARRLRRRAGFVGLLATLAAGIVGYLFGLRASRPLVSLQHDTERLDAGSPASWQVRASYGSPEVDDVAAALNRSLERVAEESRERTAALDAARSFAAAANHELRTPLQSARTQLDLAADPRADAADTGHALDAAREQLDRMGATLGAVGALAQAELVDPARFELLDLADVVDEAVAISARRDDPTVVDVHAPTGAAPVRAWREGVTLVVGNLVRNARLHGRHADGGPARVVVRVEGARIVVEDDGPGIPAVERTRVLERFARGANASAPGSGLGLALVVQVARAHGGSVEIDTGELGGARVSVTLAP